MRAMASGIIKDEMDIYALSVKYECSIDYIAVMAGVPVEHLVRSHVQKPIPPSSLGKVTDLVKVFESLRKRKLDPVLWLQGLILEGIPVRRGALMGKSHELVLALADGELSPEDALNVLNPDWVEGYSIMKRLNLELMKPKRVRKAKKVPDPVQ